MIVYQTETDYLSDYDNGTLTPMEFFVVMDINQVGFAKSASEAILLTAFDQGVQFSRVNVTGDLIVHGKFEAL